jgi:ribonuclease HI
VKTRIYTDGACSGNPGPGGWAAIILLATEIQKISGSERETTNNRMELKAAVEALKLANILNIKKVEIISDSAYLVNAINKGWITKWVVNKWRTVNGDPVKNKDLWIQLLSVINLLDVTFVKVKGHSGDLYNERVDKIAKREVERITNRII